MTVGPQCAEGLELVEFILFEESGLISSILFSDPYAGAATNPFGTGTGLGSGSWGGGFAF